MSGTLSDEYLSLAAVLRPHGLKGEVKIRLTCDGLDRLLGCKALLLVRSDGTAGPATVVKSFIHSDGDAVVRLKEVEGRDASEALRGAFLAVREKDAEPLQPGHFRRHELLGLSVETIEGRPLGKVEDLLEMPAQWVLVVRGDAGNEILLPAHPGLVKSVDLKARRLVVDYQGVVNE